MGFEARRRAQPDRAETALVLRRGSIEDLRAAAPLLRIHSQCTTGDVFHSLRCDCHDQLHMALAAIAAEDAGILIYEHQEGRGIGLMDKLRAYALQDSGLDTLEANIELGHAIDLRDYALPVEILKWLRISAVRLMTDNPQKVCAVASAGIQVCERLSASVPGNVHSARYLRTKKEKLGHYLQLAPETISAAESLRLDAIK